MPDNPVDRTADTANWQSYFFASFGSLPANIGIAVFQTLAEMMIDTARMGVEIVRVPLLAQRGHTETAIRSVVQVSMDAAWNLVRNLFRPIRRSHLIGIEARYMMDVGMAFKHTLRQIARRWRLFWTALKNAGVDDC